MYLVYSTSKTTLEQNSTDITTYFGSLWTVLATGHVMKGVKNFPRTCNLPVQITTRSFIMMSTICLGLPQLFRVISGQKKNLEQAKTPSFQTL